MVAEHSSFGDAVQCPVGCPAPRSEPTYLSIDLDLHTTIDTCLSGEHLPSLLHNIAQGRGIDRTRDQIVSDDKRGRSREIDHLGQLPRLAQ